MMEHSTVAGKDGDAAAEDEADLDPELAALFAFQMPAAAGNEIIEALALAPLLSTLLPRYPICKTIH